MIGFAFFLSSALLTLGVTASLAHRDFFVANCTVEGPAALVAAQTWVRALARPLTSNVTVRVVGTCDFSKMPQAPFLFDQPGDFGEAPYTVRWIGDDSAEFVGGRLLHAEKWLTVSDSEWRRVSGAPLPSVPGATLLKFDAGDQEVGEFANGGLGYCAQTRAELFVKSAPMTIARFPNAPLQQGKPWMDWLHVASVDAGDVTNRLQQHPRMPASALRGTKYAANERAFSTFGFEAREKLDLNRAAIWNATSAATWSHAWLHGFWMYDWADNFVRVANVSISSALRAAFDINSNTPPVYGIAENARFYVVNLAAELDSVGEYWIDSLYEANTTTIYFLASSGLDPRSSSSPAYLSTVDVPFVSLANAHDLLFSNILMQYSRGLAFRVTGSAERVALSNLTISNVGTTSLEVSVDPRSSASTHPAVTITNFVSRFAGCRAVTLSGGNDALLFGSNISFIDGDVAQYARWIRTYNPGVAFSGVGITVAGSRFALAPHNGLLGGGNNHLFTDNVLEDLCYEVRDSGAFYIGRSWVNRGMMLRRNVFRRIRALEPTELGANSVQAMYFDDEQSGVTAIDNVCVDVHACFLVGGGRDNTLLNNSCSNLTSSCILFDNRGMNWQHAMCTNSSASGPGQLVQQLMSVHYQHPPYSRYPGLPSTMQEWPCVPVGNVFIGNRCCGGVGCASSVIDQTNATIFAWHSYEAANFNSEIC